MYHCNNLIQIIFVNYLHHCNKSSEEIDHFHEIAINLTFFI